MAGDHLTVKISPVLGTAMSLPVEGEGVDYYGFLGVKPDSLDAGKIDGAVLARTKELRRWQNSPQHGDEVVRLLPLIHRISNVLKDPKRRAAYDLELARYRRGDIGDPFEDFREMVRAALVDGSIDNASKAELLRFASQHGIDQNQAGRILRESAAAAGAAPADAVTPGEDFVVVDGGGDEFRRAVHTLLTQGRLTQAAAQRALEAAPKYSLEPGEAEQILDQMRSAHFRTLVQKVAHDGIISNNQARLLLPKAKALGIDPEAAYDIISGFTFTGASHEDLSEMSLVSAGFDDSEIAELLSKQETVVFQPQGTGAGAYVIAGMKGLLGLGVLAGLVYGAFVGWSTMSRPSSAPLAEETPEPPVTPTPEATWRPPLADPASGFLRFEPTAPDDPAAFEAKIHEVTCREYRSFLIANQHPRRPPGWGIDYSFPAGQEQYPVTGVSVADAREYSRWRARRLQLEPSRVRLPTLGEYRRMIRGRTATGLQPGEPDFWAKSELTSGAPGPVTRNKSDTLLHSNGQMYDLLGNVAEWGIGEGGEIVLLGGDHTLGPGAEVDLNLPRAAPSGGTEAVGFRIVIAPPARN